MKIYLASVIVTLVAVFSLVHACMLHGTATRVAPTKISLFN